MRALIIGGSRFMGPRIARLLAERGCEVTVFNRGRSSVRPEGVTVVTGDRDLGFAGLDGRYDAVIDTCAYNARQVGGVLSGLKFEFYLHIGTAASYKEPTAFPITEDMPIGDWPYWGGYNKGKVEAEEALARSGVPHAVLRPVYILGEANHVPRESFIYSKIKAGEPIILPGDGRAKAQFVFVQDVAKAVVRMVMERMEGVFNCCGDENITLRQLVDEMARIAGGKAEIRFNPAADGAAHRLDEFPFANLDFYCSNAKIKRSGVTFTPLLEGLRHDYEGFYRGRT